jgi:hypothetical protein
LKGTVKKLERVEEERDELAEEYVLGNFKKEQTIKEKHLKECDE